MTLWRETMARFGLYRFRLRYKAALSHAILANFLSRFLGNYNNKDHPTIDTFSHLRINDPRLAIFR